MKKVKKVNKTGLYSREWHIAFVKDPPNPHCRFKIMRPTMTDDEREGMLASMGIQTREQLEQFGEVMKQELLEELQPIVGKLNGQWTQEEVKARIQAVFAAAASRRLFPKQITRFSSKGPNIANGPKEEGDDAE